MLMIQNYTSKANGQQKSFFDKPLCGRFFTAVNQTTADFTPELIKANIEKLKNSDISILRLEMFPRINDTEMVCVAYVIGGVDNLNLVHNYIQKELKLNSKDQISKASDYLTEHNKHHGFKEPNTVGVWQLANLPNAFKDHKPVNAFFSFSRTFISQLYLELNRDKILTEDFDLDSICKGEEVLFTAHGLMHSGVVTDKTADSLLVTYSNSQTTLTKFDVFPLKYIKNKEPLLDIVHLMEF